MRWHQPGSEWRRINSSESAELMEEERGHDAAVSFIEVLQPCPPRGGGQEEEVGCLCGGINPATDVVHLAMRLPAHLSRGQPGGDGDENGWAEGKRMWWA
ncbi:hypothetical protein D4764_14G0005170 [Takifugu flavidus]|uniref:Uncharacterized protein n=1 Tax=Takifugu flavidus TaxID=433684 RepID=A0A5C6P404_9TELE|nr:hypothetical protein D4764_14G0005170 [Takifugu flavidus]